LSIRFPAAVARPTTTPPRPERSVRLTSHMDIEAIDGGLLLKGAARELRTENGKGEQVGASSVEARLGPDRVLLSVDVEPDDGTAYGLVGRVVGRGFRSAVSGLFDHSDSSGGTLRILLDDLPAAALISGYAALYAGEVDIQTKHLEAGLLQADICSGWRSDGTMLVTVRERGHLPVPIGPPANSVGPDDDPDAWHDSGPLAARAMRRRRLVQIADGDPIAVFAMFRDNHVDGDGVESVLHEYTLNADLDRHTRVLTSCRAEPRVLPWPECPSAADSARRVEGRRIDELGAFVSKQLRGIGTCTHLNDLLHSLTRVPALFAYLPRADASSRKGAS
jgi:hypothetical protein